MSGPPFFRGGHAPRGGRGRWNKAYPKPTRDIIQPDLETNPLGQLVKTFNVADLNDNSKILAPAESISDLRYVASYNWRSDKTTTILVPSKPPQWTPVQDMQRLHEDNGLYYRDPNAARYPEFPVAPVVQSILDLDPDFPTARTDVVACGSTFGNLLRFVRGQDKAFRFAVQAVGNTVFFVRKENNPREFIENIRGYGHTFPEANTTWENDVRGSETHQRIVQYNFAGFSCLVRFECDGYIKDKSASFEGDACKKGISKSDLDNSLSAAFDAASVAQAPVSELSGADRIRIERGGTEVPQHSTFDLKTRSGRYKTEIDMSDIYPQLWIKQVPNFIIAYHDGAGLFKDVRVQDVRKDVQAWEKDNADAIHRLAVLLSNIVSFARNDNGLLELYCPRKGRLELRRQHGEGVHALPSELRKRWVNEVLSEFNDDDFTSSREYHSGEDWKADSDEDGPDYTACSAEDCGYCGKCSY